MTLDEAIAHAEEKAKGDDACAKEHEQLAAWLRELRLRRNVAEETGGPKIRSLLCNAQHEKGPFCIKAKNHEGLHRALPHSPEWASPRRFGRCQAVNSKKEQCALDRDHWEAHRNWDGDQWIEGEV
jgi:hypothetical protein